MPQTIDHTIDEGVLPTPSPVEYDVDTPAGAVSEFDTGLILVIR